MDGVIGTMGGHELNAALPAFDQVPWPRIPEKLVVVGLNWLGDAVMAMPALQAFRRCYPGIEITMLSRAPLDSLWRLSEAVDEVCVLPKGVLAVRALAKLIRAEGFDSACILPNSFRSSLLPLLARVAHRRGIGGQWRTPLLTDAVSRWDQDDVHQGWEVVRLMGLGGGALSSLEPSLVIDDAQALVLAERVGVKGRPVALIPGAARGDAKRWPAAHYVKTAKLLASEGHESFAVVGTEAERGLCESVAEAIGDGAVCVAGQTSLGELALLLSRCRCVVCNDSGGMHLAAAVGTPLVAVFGITDPVKTGPLGGASRVVSLPGAVHRRDVPRTSAEACRVLSAIEPERVVAEVVGLLSEAG